MYLFRSIYKLFYNSVIRNQSFSAPSNHIVCIVILWSLSVFVSPNSHADWHLVDTLKGHTDAVNSLAFSSDGRLLASGSKDKTVIIWNALTGRREKTLTGHSGEVYSVAFSSNGQMLASASEDGNIILWNPETGEKLAITHNGVHSIAFSPDGQLLASGSWLGTVRLWNPKTGQQVYEVPLHKERVYSVTFSPDGALLASSSWDSTIKLWNLKQKKVVHTLGLRGGTYANFITFSPDGRLLASGLQDGTIKLWNPETGEPVGDIAVKKDPVVSVAFSSDGQLLASDAPNNTIKIWNLKTQRVVTTLKGHQGNVTSVAFSPKKNLLASASSDGMVKLWQDTELSIIILDTTSTPPKTVIMGSQIQGNSATFRFSVDPITVSDKIQYSWRLDKGQWTETREKSVVLNNLSDGFHLFEIRAIDMNGNEGIAETSFYVKPTPEIVTHRANLPETEILSKLKIPVKTKEITIQFKGEDTPQTHEDKLRYKWCFDGGEWFETKETSVILNNLLNGWHLFQVKAKGADGMEDPTPATAHFEVAIEEQLPKTYIVSAPEDTVKTSEVTIWFRGGDAQTPFENLRYKWRFDGGDWFETKETSVTLKNLSSEWHLFEVKAINAKRYEDSTPAQIRFTVDFSEKLPYTKIDNAPTTPIKTAYYKFWFSGEDKQTPTEKLRYSWRFDNGPWSKPSAETSKEFADLPNGQHLFEVKAIDTDRNEDATPAKAPFTVEISKEPPPPQTDEQQFPKTQITYGPKDVVKAADFTFRFEGKSPKTVSEQLQYSWRVDGKPWTSLSTKTDARVEGLSNGQHLFQVKAVDANGKEDLTPAEQWFIVEIDEKLPNTELVGEIPKLLKANDVTIKFKGIDSDKELKYSWSLDDGNWSNPSPEPLATLKSLSDGWHIFKVKAITATGEDPTPVEHQFQVDIDWELPRTEIIKAPESKVKTSDVIFHFTGNDLQTPTTENLQYSWRINEGPWIPPTENKGRLGKEYGMRNAKWQIGEEKEILELYDLDNCRHLFEVKAIDSDDNEDPTPATKLFVIAVPFYYQSWFLISIIFVTVCILFYFIYRYVRSWRALKRKFNPFKIPADQFIPFESRQSLIGDVMDNLRKGSSVILYGGRRLGKTTLLRQIEQRASMDFLCVFFDVTSAEDNFFYALMNTTVKKVCDASNESTPKLAINDIDVTDYSFGDFLDDLSDLLFCFKQRDKGMRILWLLDEIDKLNDFSTQVQEHFRSIFTTYQHQVQTVMSGMMQEHSKSAGNQTSPWYNMFVHEKVKPLSDDEVKAFIHERTQHYYKFDDDALDFILKVCYGTPPLLLSLCESTIEKAIERNNRRVKLDDVKKAFRNDCLTPNFNFFPDLWMGYSEKLRYFLKGLVDGSDGDKYIPDDIQIQLDDAGLLEDSRVYVPSEFQNWIRRNAT